MPELLPKDAIARARWVWLLGWAIAASAFPPLASAESLPVSVRSCAAEPDPGRRLACYDKAVARFTETSPPAGTKQAATAECCAGATAGDAHTDSKSNIVPGSAGPDRSDLNEEHKQMKGAAPKRSRGT
jgi:hypothetical protein